MSKVKHGLLKLLTSLEDRYDTAKQKRRQRKGLGTLMIMPFIGYGTPQQLVLRGRVLRDKRINPPMDSAGVLTNVVDMYKRFMSDEVPGTTVRASFGDQFSETVTDIEGFFEFRFQPGVLPPDDDHMILIPLEVVDYPGKDRNPVEPASFEAVGQVIIPPDDAEFGIISDIDDTVLRSNVSDILSLVRNTFLENAHTRLPFEGVAKLYQALRRGSTGGYFNPIFYVSSSSWNIYDVLHDFFIVREIPLGALFLSEYNLNMSGFLFENQREHKVEAIETILEAYPNLPFVLIGDSSEKDPLIYHEVVGKYPHRIKAIYIRAASPDERRTAEIQALSAEVDALGVPMLLVEDSYTAALHASQLGLIHPDALPTIREERTKDMQAPTPTQQALNLPPSDTAQS